MTQSKNMEILLLYNKIIKRLVRSGRNKYPHPYLKNLIKEIKIYGLNLDPLVVWIPDSDCIFRLKISRYFYWKII